MIVAAMPLINPPITGVEIKLTSLPAFKIENSKSHNPANNVIRGTTSIACCEAAAIPCVLKNAPTTAHGAASTPNIN